MDNWKDKYLSEAALNRLAKTILENIKAGQGVNVRRIGGSIIIDALANSTWMQAYQIGGQGTADNPVSILPATHEGPETAQTDTWDRDDQPEGKDGVKIKLMMRTVYNASGDQKVYGFYREATFDSCGCCKSISAETRYEIDNPEVC